MGTVIDCLASFSQKIGGDHKTRNTICDLLGIGHSTGKRWFSAKGVLPVGENLVRLRYLLELYGYEVFELKCLPPDVYNFGKLIAFGTISIEDAINLLDIGSHRSRTNHFADGLYRILHGKDGTDTEKTAKMKEVVDSFQKELNSKIQFWKDTLNIKEIVEADQVGTAACPFVLTDQVDTDQVDIDTNQVDQLDHNIVLECFHHQVLAMIPLAQAVNSDGFSQEERRLLRVWTKKDRTNGVFELSNLLLKLCSETARKEIN